MFPRRLPWNCFLCLIIFYYLSHSLLLPGNSHTMLNIAHRGASGDLPELTLAAISLAIDQGCDIVEIDIGITKDAILIAMHEPHLSKTTNIQSIKEYANRQRKIGRSNDWWITDFTFAELQTIKRRQPDKNRNHSFDDIYTIPSLQQVIQLIIQRNSTLYIEIKESNVYDNYFKYNLPSKTIVDLLLEELKISGIAVDKVIIETNLQSKAKEIQTKGPQSDEGEGYKIILSVYSSKDSQYYLKLSTQGIFGIGLDKNKLKFDKIMKNNVTFYQETTGIVELAHKLNMVVYVWTFYNDDPQTNNIEMKKFYCAKTDGLFHDHPKSMTDFLKDPKNLMCN